MKIQTLMLVSRRWQAAAFTLIEVMVAMAVAGIVFVSLYAGISGGVGIVQISRENLRATQIMVEQMETMRLLSWEQVTSGTNIPPTFEEFYFPIGTNSGRGLKYYGTIDIQGSAVGATYANAMRMVIINLRWTNGSVPHVREMRTYVARDGMQNYIF